MKNKPLLIILMAIWGLAGCGLVPPADLIRGQVNSTTPTVNIINSQIPPTLEPTTTFQFPATWTPYKITQVTSTKIDTSTPGITLTPNSKTATPLYPTGSTTIVGSVSRTTSSIPFLAGKITIVWKYSGAVQEQDNLTTAQKAHKDRLATLYANYVNTMTTLNSNLTDATNRNDTVQVSHWKDEINRYQAQYNQDVNKEYSTYQSEINKITTSFGIKINRISVNKPVILVTAKGTYVGQATYKTVSAPDYYFIIDAAGPYQIDITRGN